MSVKAFGLDHVLADDGETGFVRMLFRVRVRAARCRCWSREEPYGPVRKNAIHVEENYFDLLCAMKRVCHWYLVLGIWRNRSGPNIDYQLPIPTTNSRQLLSPSQPLVLSL